VEFYSVSRGRRWVPARVEGVPAAWHRAVALRVEEDDARIACMAPSRVRRRFVDGGRVRVFRGPDAGWRSGVIDSSTLPFVLPPSLGAGELPCYAPGAGDFAPPSGTVTPATSEAGTKYDAPTDLWSMVPFREEHEGCAIWVPSYLVRLLPAHIVDL